jgi:hypothetical protein
MKNPGLFDRVFDLDKPFFHHWQKLLGIEKLLGFFQRAKSRPGVGAATVSFAGRDGLDLCTRLGQERHQECVRWPQSLTFHPLSSR